MSNGSPWVNWQQFASMNESETQRMAEEARTAREAQQSEVQRLSQQLASEASAAGKQGGYRGIEGLGSYQQLMEAQKKAMGQPAMGAVAKAPWEALMPGAQQDTGPNPWADLSKYMTAAQQAGQVGQQYYKTQRATQGREMDEYNRRKQAEQDRARADRQRQEENMRRDMDATRYDLQRRRYAGKMGGL